MCPTLTPLSPPELPSGTISTTSLCLSPLPQADSAQPLGTSQPNLCPPVLPAWGCHCPSLPPSHLSSVPSHAAGTLGSDIQEEMQAVSNPHFTLASAKLIHGKDLAVTKLVACICLVPGSLEVPQPAEDRWGCQQQPQFFSCFPVGAGTFGVTVAASGGFSLAALSNFHSTEPVSPPKGLALFLGDRQGRAALCHAPSHPAHGLLSVPGFSDREEVSPVHDIRPARSLLLQPRPWPRLANWK